MRIRPALAPGRSKALLAGPPARRAVTSNELPGRAISLLGSAALMLATGNAGGQPAVAPPAEDEQAVLKAAYPDYDPRMQQVPLRWKSASVPWFDPTLEEATHVLLQVVAARDWGPSDRLVLTSLRYDSREAGESGAPIRNVMPSKAELLLVHRESLAVRSRFDLGVLRPSSVDEQFDLPGFHDLNRIPGSSELRFDSARYDLDEHEIAAGIRVSESSRDSLPRGWLHSLTETLLLFRVGPGGLELVFRGVMLQEDSQDECDADTDEQARDLCACRSLEDVQCLAETADTQKRVLVVSPKKTRGFFDLMLRGTTEKHVGGKRASLKKDPAETYRWDGSRYVRAGAWPTEAPGADASRHRDRGDAACLRRARAAAVRARAGT